MLSQEVLIRCGVARPFLKLVNMQDASEDHVRQMNSAARMPVSAGPRKYGDPPLYRQAAYPVRSGCDINFLRSSGMHGMYG